MTEKELKSHILDMQRKARYELEFCGVTFTDNGEDIGGYVKISVPKLLKYGGDDLLSKVMERPLPNVIESMVRRMPSDRVKDLFDNFNKEKFLTVTRANLIIFLAMNDAYTMVDKIKKWEADSTGNDNYIFDGSDVEHIIETNIVFRTNVERFDITERDEEWTSAQGIAAGYKYINSLTKIAMYGFNEAR